MNIAGFKIWYADGSMIAADDWTMLPPQNAIIVMTYFVECFEGDSHYRCMTDGGDWYWFDGKAVQTIPSKAEGWQDPPDGVDEALLKQGVMISDEEFKRITDIAMADLEWHELS